MERRPEQNRTEQRRTAGLSKCQSAFIYIDKEEMLEIVVLRSRECTYFYSYSLQQTNGSQSGGRVPRAH